MQNVIERPVAQATGDQYSKIADLITSYAYALDDGKIDLWPEFFTNDGIYHITTQENHDAELPIGIMRCVGRGMMTDRVKAFHTANIFEPHKYNHIIGRPIMSQDKGAGSVSARSNFQIVRIMETGRMELFATGKYLDVVQVENGILKFRERVIVLDSRNVDILIVVPL
ncbi:aromatic-ring-hydroxylating dioxygenase subunit beta [Bradyrhizobium genosp. P]|uniref:aromatic-ring-hydroxylating dioxygenase subunit beta n=1 Tax=Bradyrhizobium genosp. P TaxID=83641 RepID=UPI003CE867AC